jgi:hypothetical protein
MTILSGERAKRFEALVAPLNRALAAAGQPPLDQCVLAWRAEKLGLPAPSRVSANGSCRLLSTKNGAVALSLARPDDRELLPALIGREMREISWPRIAKAACGWEAEALVGWGALLGLPIARLGEAAALESSMTTRLSQPREPVPAPLIVDLSSLWAGPFCAHLLGRLGGRVVKVESLHRPDAARTGSPALFHALNDSKEVIGVDFRATEGLANLRELLGRADIVVEGSRPRALRQLGIDAAAFVQSGKIWASITAYGREGDAAMRVGFGDDAAIAGGLADRDRDGGVRFLGDALADPLGGLAACRAILAARAAGGGVLIDVRLAGAAAEIAAARPAVAAAA